jgi:hypothetical protein
MWKHRYAFVCALITLLGATALTSFAQSPDPSTLPLVQFADLVYQGAFRLPKGFTNGEEFAHGGEPVAFNPGRNSLFIGNRAGKVAEVSIPALVSSSDVTRLNFSSFVQAFFEPTEGAITQIPGDRSITGLLVMGENLYGSAAVYYDANNDQKVSHYARSTTLSQRSAVGMKQVWTDKHTGFVSGYMATVPQEWQQKLGGPAVTGQCCIPIAWRTSWGPAAFAFNPQQITASSQVSATPLLYYSDAHPTLGLWEGNNQVYSAATTITGMVFVANSRTVLYIGRTGTGPFCYGEGTKNPALNGLPTSDGSEYCYDPTDDAKGQHGYPYNYQIWAYDMNDLAAVKAGTKNPWDVRPYAVWPFTLPTTAAQSRIGGVGYDAARQIIYISQMYADQDTYDYRPIIHALKINGVAGAPMPPPSTATLPPVTVSSSFTPGPTPVTALAIAANKTAPQPAGTTMTFTATATGGTTPLQYKWLVHNGLAWVQMGDWSTANTFNWTPATANSQYRVGVWVRGGGSTTDTAEFTASMDYAVGNSTSYTAPYQPTTAVTIAADKAAPQPAGSMITWTATATGGEAPRQYKWLVHNGLQWNAVTGWSTSNTFVWTPALVNSQYRIGVWVRSAGATSDAADASSSADFAINGVSVAIPPPTTTSPPPTTTTSTGRLTALSMTPNKAAPQASGTAITFTATPTGGIAPHQYKWLVHNGLQWNEVAGWSTSNTFTWTPSSGNSQYRVGVWVRQAGNTADVPEFTQSMDYPITGGTVTVITPPPSTTTPPPPPPTTTGARLTEVTLRSDKPAPQEQNTTIAFVATPNGGAYPQQYKWLVHDGYQWKVISDWGTSNTFNWTPAAWNSQYRFGVWVRSAGNTADAAEATASMDFPIVVATNAPPPPPPTTTTSAPLTAVTIGTNRIAPQPAGTMITLTAIPTGGVAQQYKWMVHDGLNWSTVTSWSTSNTFNWTPPTANSAYRIGVWARNGGNTTDTPQATYSMDFPISAGTTTAVTPPPTTTTARLTDVALSANLPAPQRAGTTVVLTAQANGGTAPQYKWLIHDGLSWSAVSGWSSANTFSWTPAVANSGYRVGVWVRTNGSTVDVAEATKSMDFPITQ